MMPKSVCLFKSLLHGKVSLIEKECLTKIIFTQDFLSITLQTVLPESFLLIAKFRKQQETYIRVIFW